MKAFAIISTMINLNFQSMGRSACKTAQAWGILKNFFLRRSFHNKIQKQRELHEFKMKKCGNVMAHFLRFDELCMSMQANGAVVNLEEQLGILLGSDQVVKIMENIPGMDLFQA